MTTRNLRFFPALFLTASCTFIFLTMPVPAQGNTPLVRGDGCMTAQCHGELQDSAFIHGPISAGECTVCHGESPKHKKNPVRYTFKKTRNGAETCYTCHEPFPSKKFTHNPVAGGECTACHDPHGSPNKFQLLARSRDLCFTCHDKSIIAGKFVHGPAAVDGCVACHDPHTADFSQNLKAEGPDLCYTCHTDKKNAVSSAKYVHMPISMDCTNCHNPHSAEEKFMLLAEVPSLCLDCHDQQKKEIGTATTKHAALETGGACLNCHDAHMSSVAKNLIMEPMDLCISCHNRTYEKENGRDVTNMAKVLADNTDHHGPIKQKDCSGCHNPHGSDNFRILRKPYPSTFYQPFAVDNYGLCFSCHEKTIVLDRETTKLTNFRNGNQNLHFTHVNKPVKGRTCRACHETHGSNYPKHIREAVPFGSWDLPVEFRKTETGGSCTTGCHQQKKYDNRPPPEDLWSRNRPSGEVGKDIQGQKNTS